MGTMRKVGQKWRAEIRRAGMYRSENFPTQSAARAWINRTEADYDAGKRGAARKTFGQALARYAEEVSPKKRGARWEQIRLKALGRDKIAAVPLVDLRPAVFADWRDRRLKQVSPSSVAREMALLRGVVTIAIAEWQWLYADPMKGVVRPKQAPHRQRLPSEAEIRALAASLRFDGTRPLTQQQRVAVAFLLALQTGMRAGEILSLTAAQCFERHVHLPITKNGDARDVPLTPRAAELVALVKPDVGRLFPMTSRTLDTLFRRARDRAGIVGLTFHDSRHYFCTWAARKVPAVELAKIVGHRNLSQLLAYYNPSVAEIADRIAS